MSPMAPTRRLFARLLAAVAMLSATRAAGVELARDRGIGGTGAAPPSGDDDRGIGGTGVVGTIRRFGSIVVNDLRIGYKDDVAVTIDGQPAAPGDLRIGHVVHVAAFDRDGGLATPSIAVWREVVGPVQRRSRDHLVVLGQTVATGDLSRPHRWRKGRRVAVSGLRAPDGRILASLIEPDHRGIDLVAGELTRMERGVARIGRLEVRHVDPALVGQRVIALGAARRGAFVPARVTSAVALLAELGTTNLSLEAYLRREGATLRGGPTLTVDAAVAREPVPERDLFRAVLSATIGPDRQVTVQDVRVQAQEGHGISGRGPDRSPGRTGPGAADGPGGPGSGAGPGGSGPGGSGQPHGAGPHDGAGVHGGPGAPGGPSR